MFVSFGEGSAVPNCTSKTASANESKDPNRAQLVLSWLGETTTAFQKGSQITMIGDEQKSQSLHNSKSNYITFH